MSKMHNPPHIVTGAERTRDYITEMALRTEGWLGVEMAKAQTYG